MATTAWKGHLTFGLVSILLKLYPAARSETVRFHLIHKTCRTRLRRPLFCPTCHRLVERTEVLKGYEYEKGQYLLIESKRSKSWRLTPAGPWRSANLWLSPRSSHFTSKPHTWRSPEKSGAKAYRLLVETMEQTGKAALAKIAMHQREYLVAIRAREHGLTIHTMYFNNELRRRIGIWPH